jgi:hypothetical protein
MDAKEVFANYHNFNPIGVQHSSINVKRPGTQVKKVIVKVSCKIYLSRSRSRNSDLRLWGAGAERNNFGSATLFWQLSNTTSHRSDLFAPV